MSKLFFYDLETTGTNPAKNGIHQIAGQIVINDKVKESFDFKVKPNPMAKVSEIALEVGGVTLDEINAYPEMSSVLFEIKMMLEKYVDKFDRTDKFFLVGYNNNAFDNPFFRGFFLQNGDRYFGSWFWSSSIDVMSLAANYLQDVRHEMKDFKLMTVAKQLGIDVDNNKLHDGNYDIALTKEIYYLITKNK